MDSDGCTRQTEKKLTSASSLVKILSTGLDAAADSSGARDVVQICRNSPNVCLRRCCHPHCY